MNKAEAHAAKAAVVIPTYNEAENIGRLIERILALGPDFHVIVVDDHSPDGTGDIVRSYPPDRVTLVDRVGERGYGSAVVRGFREALGLGVPLIVGMDSDFSHDPDRIPDLIEAVSEADVVVGSRYCPNGGTINWPVYRMVLSRTANQYVRAILGIPCRDSTSGFRCYRREALAAIDLDQIRSEGYSFLVELLYRVHLNGASIREIPILFLDRLKGKSKISTREIYRSIFMVLWLRWSLPRSPR